MLDLARSERETSVIQRGTALIYVADDDLARIVSLLLRTSGFEVERCSDIDQLQTAAERVGIRVVLIAGGVNLPGTHPLGGFIAKRDRDYLLVTLVRGESAAARLAGADHVVTLPFDPGTFTEEILRRLAPAWPADTPSPSI
jgi:hypothetical protein